ncbi:MAG: ATP-binding protein, partial [Acidobacteriota bacterium]
EGRDFFGLAQGKAEDGRYIGFSYGKPYSPILDGSLLLIEPPAAAAYLEALRREEEASRAEGADTGGGDCATPVSTSDGGAPRGEDAGKGGHPSGAGATGPAPKKRFYGSVELDPIQAKKQFADLVDEVVQQFIMRRGVNVSIAIEIQAESSTGFDDGLQRAVKTNCDALKFRCAEFESGA